MDKKKRESKPTFSVITVVYNDVKNIEKTIKSVLNQTCNDYEYIVIDGNSNDGTTDIIKKYNKDIDCWVSEKDEGIYDAMNKGVGKARGDYVYFLNSGDTFFSKDVLKRIAPYLIGRDYALLNGQVVRLYEGYQKTVRPNPNRLKYGESLPHQGAFIKKATFDKLGGYNLIYISASDFDFFCKFFQNKFSYKLVSNKIANMPSGGFSSIKEIGLPETQGIIKKYFGAYYASKFHLTRILIEQNIKKLFIKMRMNSFLEKLVRYNNLRKGKKF